MQSLHGEGLVKVKLGHEIKYLCCSIDVSSIGLFKMAHRVRAEKLSQRREAGRGAYCCPAWELHPPLLPLMSLSRLERFGVGLVAHGILRLGHRQMEDQRAPAQETWQGGSEEDQSLLLLQREDAWPPSPAGAGVCGPRTPAATCR